MPRLPLYPSECGGILYRPVRSIKAGLALTIGAPLGATFAISLILHPRYTGNGWLWLELCFLALAFVMAMTLVSAVPRLALLRRLRPAETDAEVARWRRRQLGGAQNSLKVLVALGAIIAPLLWVEGFLVSGEPGDHGVLIEVPAKDRFLTAEIPEPEALDCESENVLQMHQNSGGGRPVVLIGSRRLAPIETSPQSESYRLPLSWPRTKYSCFYEFPNFRSSGHVPVNLYLRDAGSAEESTPGPVRVVNGFWGWRCSARGSGDDCAVMGVLNRDPGSAVSATVLLLVGAAVAIVLSVLVSAVISVWRGWAEDARAALAAVAGWWSEDGLAMWKAVKGWWSNR
jgi:hypothetical protein